MVQRVLSNFVAKRFTLADSASISIVYKARWGDRGKGGEYQTAQARLFW